MINFSEIKKFCIFSFIGSLIIAALVAVVTVLMGHFNEITGKVFLTLFMVVLHSLVSLMFVWDDSRQKTFEKLSFFINTIFVIIILSFFASLFGIWKIVEAETVGHFYQTFFLLAFASLHADILSKAFGKEKYMNMLIFGNYAFIAIVFLMLQPTIYVANAVTVLGEMYYRFLAAAAIIDGTLSVLTIIFYKLYLHNHPEVKNGESPIALPFWIIILFLPFLIFFIFFIIGVILNATNYKRSEARQQTQENNVQQTIKTDKIGTYLNTDAGFTFQYPQDKVTITELSSNKMLINYIQNDANHDNQRGQWEITVYDNPYNVDLDSWLDLLMKTTNDNNCSIVSSTDLQNNFGKFAYNNIASISLSGKGGIVCKNLGFYAMNPNKTRVIKFGQDAWATGYISNIITTLRFSK